MYFYLPDEYRQKFTNPLGILLRNKQSDKNTIKTLLNDSQFITIGDTTTEKLLNFNLIPSIQIIDNNEKRIARKPIQNRNTKTNLYCNNPPGQITEDSIKTIKTAFGLTKPVRIIVSGEEDLLTIPVCIYAPENYVILYGQPNEGLVVVKVNNEIRKNVLTLMRYMNQRYDEIGG